ncbi:hypothetical protein BDV26DRAFT_278426 [Aspergillus bertholletiae]|uniref:Fe2OG dioxygenase domain-containing protein n=1 Tax=Aspergillus bertholletiae TaxID=1226010 RepID=A0A5N7BJ55_9EURO|nr:hypothetical protein BDV26DRAFT_278426 [Aspergillus bertholletiae]
MGCDNEAKAKLVEEVRKCCHYNGFFQITGHRVPLDLQCRVVNCSKRFFDLPLEEKIFNRGYKLLQLQMLEAGTGPELKEGLYIGEEIPEDHPYFIQKKLNSGPNLWPQTVPNKEDFQKTTMEYYHALFKLGKGVLGVVALTLGVDSTFFEPLTEGAVATMRYLYYPAQLKDQDEKLNRGIGNDVDGLQVLDVKPVEGVYVVNLGDLFIRMANDKYKSNIHRVINKSGRERYSIPFFFSGNLDYLCECLPNCRDPDEPAKYPPITVQDRVTEAYQESYGRAEKYKKDMEMQSLVSTPVVASYNFQP